MTDFAQNMRGAGLMALAMAGFAAGDSLMKVLLTEIPLGQVILLRGALTTLLIVLVAKVSGVFESRLPVGSRLPMALRSLAEVGAAYCFMTALQHMPLASITAILQALPLAVTLAGAVFLQEAVGWRRALAIAAGFVGVMLIIQPGGEVFTVYSIYGLATVALCAVRDLVTRRLDRGVNSLVVTFYTSLAVTVFGAFLSLGQAWVMPSAGQVGLILLGSCILVVAYLGVVMAMRTGEVAFVAPFRYFGLIVAIVLGYAAFGDWPDALSWLGCAILVAAGVFSFWREAQVGASTDRRPAPRGATR